MSISMTKMKTSIRYISDETLSHFLGGLADAFVDIGDLLGTSKAPARNIASWPGGIFISML
jgi:hypothetical protein